LNSEMKLRVATDVTVSQPNRPHCPRPCGGENSRPRETAISGAASIIKGRRRPNRDLMLSDQEPTTGSTTASKARLTARAAPTSAPERSSTAA